jgi:hypothetical protein
MARVSIQQTKGPESRVLVEERGATTSHLVTETGQDMVRYAPDGTSPEQFLEAAFQFLLEREPASSILPTFSLPVIERYFPEYPGEVRTRLRPSVG